MGPKQPILVIFGTYISRFGTKICPNKLIFHVYIEEKIYNQIKFIKKKSILSGRLGESGV